MIIVIECLDVAIAVLEVIGLTVVGIDTLISSYEMVKCNSSGVLNLLLSACCRNAKYSSAFVVL
ncbi:hypothetical protein D3C84_987650 [compost metagenome]